MLEFGLAKPLGAGSPAPADSVARTGAAADDRGSAPRHAGLHVAGAARRATRRRAQRPLRPRRDPLRDGHRAARSKARHPAMLIAAVESGARPQPAPGDPPLPALFERIVAKCLAKDRVARWQSATDLADALRWGGRRRQGRPAAGWPEEAAEPSPVDRGWRTRADRHPAEPRASLQTGRARPACLYRCDHASRRSSVGLPNDVARSSSPSGRFALSPDGRRLALVAADATGRTQLWTRPLESSSAQPLAGTEGATFRSGLLTRESIAFVTRGS